VRVQHQRPAAAGSSNAPDHVRAAGCELVVLALDPALGEPAGDEPGELGLAGAAGDERRVYRLDRDELLEQRTQAGTVKQSESRNQRISPGRFGMLRYSITFRTLRRPV
jgi:hypothetical protein